LIKIHKYYHPGIFLDTDKERVYVIEVPTLPGKPYAEVMHIGDLHIGHKDFAPRFLGKYLAFLKSLPERRAVMMGDYFEHEEGTSFIKEQVLDFQQQVVEFIKFFAPVSKQVVAMVYGNHDERYCKATSSGVDLLDYLRLKIGNPDIAIAPPQRGLIVVFLVKKTIGDGYFVYPEYILHSSTASIVNLETQFRRTADNFDTPIIAHGHTHKIFWKENTRFIVAEDEDGNFSRAVVRQYWLSTGSFLRFPSYGETKCVDEQTEILTYQGWKKYTDLKEQQSVPTLNMKSGKIEYQPLQWVSKYYIKEPISIIEGRNISSWTTMNHRNILKEEKGYSEKISKDLVKRDRLVVNSKEWSWKENTGIGDKLAFLIGGIITEGHYRKNGMIEFYQNNNSYYKEILDIIQNFKIPHFLTSRRRKGKEQKIITLTKSPWNQMIKEIIPEKKLTLYLTNLPRNELEFLFDSMMKGDGHKDLVFTQKEESTVDLFQIIALKLGYNAMKTKVPGRNIYRVYLNERELVTVEGKREEKEYEGIVWCPRVENGTWIARRNGKVFITGNSYPVPDMGAPILRFYADRPAVEYVDPRTTYGLDQEPFAETYEKVIGQELKDPQEKFETQNLPEIKNLKCPECGQYRIGSKGPEWQCKSCGKRWMKNPRRKEDD